MNSFTISKTPFIAVYDGVVDYNTLAANFNFLHRSSYKYANRDNPFPKPGQSSKLYNDFFSKGVYHDKTFNDFYPLLLTSISSILQTNIDPNTTLAQVNVSDLNTVDMRHIDYPFFDKHYTILYYANLEWDDDYGGETLFYDPKSLEIMAAVKPKPGRFVIFDGAVPHSARPPQIHCPYKRYTVAVKLIPQNLSFSN